MSDTIWKFPVPVQADPIIIDIPNSNKFDPFVLQLQEGVPMLWAIVKPQLSVTLSADAEAWARLYGVKRKLQWFGTGHSLPAMLSRNQHLGTIQLDGFVWHLFDMGRA